MQCQLKTAEGNAHNKARKWCVHIEVKRCCDRFKKTYGSGIFRPTKLAHGIGNPDPGIDLREFKRFNGSSLINGDRGKNATQIKE